MTKEQMEKWVAALRSEEYSQTVGRLRNVKDHMITGFCCLGVLADVRGVDWRDRSDFVYDDNEILKDKWCGISESWQNKLADLNDNGHDFKQIADFIESNYEYFEGDYHGGSFID